MTDTAPELRVFPVLWDAAVGAARPTRQPGNAILLLRGDRLRD